MLICLEHRRLTPCHRGEDGSQQWNSGVGRVKGRNGPFFEVEAVPFCPSCSAGCQGGSLTASVASPQKTRQKAPRQHAGQPRSCSAPGIGGGNLSVVWGRDAQGRLLRKRCRRMCPDFEFHFPTLLPREWPRVLGGSSMVTMREAHGYGASASVLGWSFGVPSGVRRGSIGAAFNSCSGGGREGRTLVASSGSR